MTTHQLCWDEPGDQGDRMMMQLHNVSEGVARALAAGLRAVGFTNVTLVQHIAQESS